MQVHVVNRRRSGRPAGRFLQRAGALAFVLVVLQTLLAGCAATRPGEFVEEPGVTVLVTLKTGESFSGTMRGIERGSLVVDHSLPKSQYLSVVRKDGSDVVYLHDVPVGTAVEVRTVDVLVRERLDFFEVEDIQVATRVYFGWGTALSAAFAFLAVQILEDI